MIRTVRNLFVVLFALFTFSAVNAEPQSFTFDNQHTYVLWTINHLGFSNQAGKWYASGSLVLDANNPSQSSVNANIDMDHLITGLPELDKHLKSKLFFDTKQFPKSTFVSNKVTPLSKNTAKVEGVLTMHGVSKPVVLDVTFNKSGINPINNKMTTGFTATTKIKRSDFGMNTLLPALGDEVNIEIDAEASQDKK